MYVAIQNFEKRQLVSIYMKHSETCPFPQTCPIRPNVSDSTSLCAQTCPRYEFAETCPSIVLNSLYINKISKIFNEKCQCHSCHKIAPTVYQERFLTLHVDIQLTTIYIVYKRVENYRVRMHNLMLMYNLIPVFKHYNSLFV